jgi:phosphomannomutase
MNLKETNWPSLQNGSDIRGVAVEGIAGQAVNLSPEVVERLATAFVAWLHENNPESKGDITVAVGRDSRISGPSLMGAFISGLTNSGANAADCGLASTPAMFMSTIFDSTNFEAGVMLTASHLPYNRNGIKFFTKAGGLGKKDITRILEIAASAFVPNPEAKGSVSLCKLMDEYSQFLVESIRKNVNHPTSYATPLAGFHIVVDAGNGSGGFFAEKVLKPLGANTTGSQYLEPDGMFPNHIPNPEDETAMQHIQKAVLDNKADLGIIFDTDVDRSAAVDQDGENINRNRLIALVSAIILEEHPGSTIVTDSITSDGLAEFIEKELGGKHHRFQRGYKNVINESIRLNNEGQESWLAIETSGHAALKENYFLDDGAFLITKILVKAAQLRLQGGNLQSLTAKLRVPLESKEYRINIKTPDFKAYGNQIITDLTKFAENVPGWKIVPRNYEGIRVSCNNGQGWFLLRLSLHDPVIPLNIESDNAGGVTEIKGILLKFLENYPELDISAMKK